MTPPPGARAMTCPQGGWMQRTQTVMGTPVGVQLWAADRVRGNVALAAVMAEMRRIGRCYGAQRADSELARVNAGAAQGPVRVSQELFRLAARARALSRLTQGACDGIPVEAPHEPRPDAAGPEQAVPSSGWRHLLLDPLAPALRFARPGVRIELGAFIDGHAVDRCCALLQRHAIGHAVVSVGGASRMLGDRRGRPWTVAVRHPKRPGDVLAELPVHDVAVSTADDLDAALRPAAPGPGRRPSPPCRVTVTAPDGMTAEALGRAVRTLGVERGLALVGQQAGADAVVVDADGQLHVTRGLEWLRPGAGPDREGGAVPRPWGRAQCAA